MPTHNVKALRKSKGLTQKETSDYVGISIRNYRAKESGFLPFTQIEISKMIDLFELNAEEVFFYFFLSK